MPIGINNKILGGTRKWIGLNSGAGIPPVASFTTSPDPATGEVPLTVSFTDTSTNSPTSWLWSITPGTEGVDFVYTVGSSTSQNPTVRFDTPNNYGVILQATNTAGSDTTSSTPIYCIDTDAQNYFDELSSQPSDVMKGYYNTFFISLKAGSNNFGKFDRFWWFGSQYQGNAAVSLKNPTSTDITEVNNPTWTQYRGYTGNGVDMYLDTNFNIGTSGVNYIQNSSSLGVYSRTNTDGFIIDIGCNNGLNRFSQLDIKDSGLFYGDLNDNGSTVTGKSVSDSMGLFIAVRTSSTNIDIYKGNVLIGSETQNVVGIPTFNVYILSRNTNGTAAQFSTRQILCSFIASGSINVSELDASITQFATSIGANV